MITKAKLVKPKTMVTKVVRSVHHLLGNKRKWYEDLREYYGVTPKQAKEAAIRYEERRPNLPASPTTHAVSGMTSDEICDSKPRNTPAEVMEWQKDLGAWSAFHQCYYHRYDSFKWLVKGMSDAKLRPQICLTAEEIDNANSLLRTHGLSKNQYICIEPHAKEAFTPNKSWFWENWQELVELVA